MTYAHFRHTTKPDLAPYRESASSISKINFKICRFCAQRPTRTEGDSLPGRVRPLRASPINGGSVMAFVSTTAARPEYGSSPPCHGMALIRSCPLLNSSCDRCQAVATARLRQMPSTNTFDLARLATRLRHRPGRAALRVRLAGPARSPYPWRRAAAPTAGWSLALPGDTQ